MRADAAASDLRREKTGHIKETAQWAKVGEVDDATQVAEYDDVLAQEAEVAAGHRVLRTTGLVTVSATDPDGLVHDGVAAVEQGRDPRGCETMRLWSQHAARLTVLTGRDEDPSRASLVDPPARRPAAVQSAPAQRLGPSHDSSVRSHRKDKVACAAYASLMKRTIRPGSPPEQYQLMESLLALASAGSIRSC